MPSQNVRPFACAAFFFSILLFAGGVVLYISQHSGRGAMPEESYYRAVYVLQSMGGLAAQERESIPSRVKYADATESLLHHPDKIMVLQTVADELSGAGRTRPRAALFEAYARLALGEKERAAALLMRHVVESEYDPAHYALLCECLYALSDDTSLLLICREWEEREPACREERTRLLWTALFNLGRLADAEEFAAKEEPCLGWQAGVYAAKAALEQAGEDAAELRLQGALRRYPQQGALALRLWERIKDKERM